MGLLFWTTLIIASVWVWERGIFYFPEVYSILKFVWADSIPMLPKVLIIFGAVMMSFFNCIMIPLQIVAVKNEFEVAFMHKDCTSVCHSPSNAAHFAAIYHHYTTAEVSTDLFVAAKMIIKAKQAKARVADKDE